MVANPSVFDAGVWLVMLIIGFVCLAFYKKIGALMLVVSILSFLVGGLIIVTGHDLTFTKLTTPANITTTSINQSSGVKIITTMTQITPINETTYLIGNSQFPITGEAQLWLGYSLILFACMIGVIFLDQTLKGNLVKGD